MFDSIGEKTLYIFGIANALSIPMVWAFYPESNQRTLEEMDILFAAGTPWNWDAERNFAKSVAENPGLVQAARRGSSVVDPEHGVSGLGGGKGLQGKKSVPEVHAKDGTKA